MRVLVVDSDHSFLSQARECLEGRGHQVVGEADVDAALSQAARWRPDVVFVSVELDACCDGDLLERIAHLSPAPAVVLTAPLERFDKAWRAWQRGGDDVLFKPLMHPSELNVAIFTAMKNAVCPLPRATDQPRALSA